MYDMLVRYVAVALGTSIGSAFRHAVDAADLGGPKLTNFLGQLVPSAVGLFIAGLIATYLALPNRVAFVEGADSIETLALSFLEGAIAGCFVFPAFSGGAASPRKLEERLPLAMLILRSLAVSFVAFFVAGLLVRITAR